MFGVLLGLMALAEAKAPESLDLGELYGSRSGWTGNAHTVPKGMFKLHPFHRSAVGVSERVDLKFGLLGQLFGPQLGGEVQLVGSDDGPAVSLETFNTINWGFNAFQSLNHVHVSVPSGDALITLTMMGGYGQVVDPVSDVVLDTWLAQPEIDITVPLSEYWAFTGMARSGLHGWANDLPNGTVGGVFSFAQGNVGFSGGLNVLVGEYVGILPPLGENAEVDISAPIVVPLPHLQLWFRL